MYHKLFRLFSHFGRIALTAESIGLPNSFNLNVFSLFSKREVIKLKIAGNTFHTWKRSKHCLMLLNQQMARLTIDGNAANIKPNYIRGCEIADTEL